jgi:sodium/bile acid cotransporter 7
MVEVGGDRCQDAGNDAGDSRVRLRPDSFTLAILVVVGIGTLLPCRGELASGFAIATNAAIAFLFFSYGARLPREAVRSGLTHWRLHLLVLACTFGVFPLLGLVFTALAGNLLPAPLRAAVLYLSIVPSTVQSSIALTSLARGNVAAAVCSASLSSLVGVVATPLLAQILGLADTSAAHSLAAVVDIARQLLLPFLLGQLARGRILGWVERQGKRWRLLDQGSILLVVYTAFSAATVRGLWRELPLSAFLVLAPLTLLLLATALLLTWQTSRALGFSREDQIVVVFCGSKKSLASGVPLANVLFAPDMVGAMVLPLMLYHQLQLMIGAVLAQRYATSAGSPQRGPAPELDARPTPAGE